MVHIYQRAQRTIVWLDREMVEHGRFLGFIEQLPKVNALKKFAEAERQFCRIWIKQEYITSPAVEVRFGNRQLHLTDLVILGRILYKNEVVVNVILERLPDDCWQDVIEASSGMAGLNTITTLVMERTARHEYFHIQSLLHLLFLYRDSVATDPRDKIYGILGLIPNSSKWERAERVAFQGYDPSLLIVDYTAAIELVYASVVRSIVKATMSLNILSACQKTDLVELPSWVPDVGIAFILDNYFVDFMTNPGVLERDFEAAKNTKAIAVFADDLKTLLIRGLITEVIDEVWGPVTRYLAESDDRQRSQANYRETALRWIHRQPTYVYHTVEDRITALWNTLNVVARKSKTAEGMMQGEMIDALNAGSEKLWDFMLR
ncbi:hypothetical protein BKA64DRAFT_639070 [Cadophora sp. MPI-SDFR-AT-0126]|nr:hypothetical protein BKA64DRAFT_639070 [Leotiomycetes sp. MPI-SDFR-AT-0126]